MDDRKNRIDERDPLTYGIRLYPVGEMQLHEFLIDEKDGVTGRGGSAMCYNAVRITAGGGLPQPGTLKEFYPADSPTDGARAFHLARRGADQGVLARQLYAKASGAQNFYTARDAFFDAYRKLAALSVENRDLNRYIPAVQLYRGVPSADDPENYTYYVWAPGDTHLMSFAAYLKSAHAEILAGENYRQHLDHALRTVRSLCRAVRLLHLRGLLHLDIKPENFGVDVDEDGVIQPENISLFDVNSFYTADDPMAAVAGTPGFRAPELAAGNMDAVGLGSDIYSLGATLFYAVAVGVGGAVCYSDDMFPRIDHLVAHSLLIEHCDENAGAGIAADLARILKRCLRREEGRPGSYNYASVKYLLEDLDRLCEKTALESAKYSAAEAHQIVRTDVIEKEEYWNEQIQTGAAGAIQWLLYNAPLYDCVSDGYADVLVLGAGIYARKFIDLAFEMAQVSDFRLRVCVVTGKKTSDKKRFLDSRPAFKEFFVVDGAAPRSDSYGEISFYQTRTPAGQTAPFKGGKNRSGNAQLLTELPQDVRFGAAFIALGDEGLNGAVAEDLAAAPDLFLPGANVHYVCYRSGSAAARATAQGPAVCPVNVTETMLRHPEYRQLRRMAFNSHLLWNGSLTALSAARAQFSNSYYFSSSLGIALAVKYKLHSIGVEIPRSGDYNLIARQTAAALDPALPAGRKRLNSLMYYEHRRWVVNRIAAGWQGLRDFSCLTGDTKDRRNMRHPCLTPSSETRALRGSEWDPEQHPRRWDETGDVSSLDPLDAASVLLHRHFLELSKEITGETLAADMAFMRRRLPVPRAGAAAGLRFLLEAV